MQSIFKTGFWLLIFLATCLSSSNIRAQNTLIYGRVTDEASGSPIGFCNVYFKGTTIGVTTDELGSYTIETGEAHDTLSAGIIGYTTKDIPITKFTSQEVNIVLSSADYALDEIVVIAGEDPAYDILKEAIARKRENDPDQYESITYSSYNKVQFDLNNFTDKIKKNFLFKPFPFIWEYEDSLANGVRYLPFLLKENVREHYYRKKPKSYKELVQGQQTFQFFRGPKIEEFIEELYLNPNVYDDFIVILNKNFPSPLNKNLGQHYKYYLADNMETINGKNCHNIKFIPRGTSDVAFTGRVFIEESSFAVSKVELSFSIDANVNFVRSFYLNMSYAQTNDGKWVNDESSVLADFTVAENASELTGFFGRRFSKYRDHVIDQPIENKYFRSVETTSLADSADLRSDTFWNAYRVDSLTKEETDIAILVDTIQQSNNFKAIRSIFTLIGTGYLPVGPVDLGHVFTFYSQNDFEGSRAKFGFRTNKKFSEDLFISAYGAYGFKDERYKYGGSLKYQFQKTKTANNSIGLVYKKDIEQIGRSYNIMPLDHVLTSFLATTAFNNRIFKERAEVFLERQWFTGMVSRLSLYREKINPYGSTQFVEIDNDVEVLQNEYKASGIDVSIRFAFEEPNINASFEENTSKLFMLRYPVVSLAFNTSSPSFQEGVLDFQKLRLRIEHQQKLRKLGYLDYRIELGKVWGQVPYPYLNVPFGNQSLLNDEVSFNLMNYLEFVSDEYISVHISHHFEGLIFNKIPLVKNLKWRLFIFGKAYFGKLTDNFENEQFVLPDSTFALNEPYYEAGFGIENIFKLGRVDFTWRLSYLDNPNVFNFLPQPSFQFRF